MLLLILGGFGIVFCGCLYTQQHKLLYHPQRYVQGFDRSLDARAQFIQYSTSQGSQMAIYIPPHEGGGLPARLWVMFHGNGATALDWVEFVERVSDPQAGFLLIDYPGYGRCEGTAWGKSILDSTRAAVDALAAHIGVTRVQLTQDLNLMGFSMGAAAAMQYAPEVQARRIVLIAPFASIREMARLSVGWPLHYLLRERYDNVARLREVLQQSPPPRVVIFHGTQDNIVPVAQSRDLKAVLPDAVDLREIEGADHNWILDLAGDQILACMAPPA